MKHLLPYFKKYKIESIIAPLFKMLESCFDLVVPIIVAAIIDKGIATGDKTYIITRFLLLIAMAVCGFCATGIFNRDRTAMANSCRNTDGQRQQQDNRQ